MYYQPPRALGLLVGAVFTLWAAGVALLLVNHGLGRALDLVSYAAYVGAVGAAALALLFGYWTYALATLSYALDRNGLVIAWGASRQVIPLGAIERLIPGDAVGVPAVRGLSWWGCHVGRAAIDRIGEVLFYSTHQSPDQVLYVITSERNYAIAVEDPAAFAHEVQVRQDLGPVATVTHHVEHSGPGAQPFWQDRTAQQLVLFALLAGAAMWAQVAARYGGLPDTLALHFPAYEAEAVVTVTSRDAILELPRVATLLLAVNLLAGAALHRWERIAGQMAFLVAGLLQLGFIAAIAIALA